MVERKELPYECGVGDLQWMAMTHYEEFQYSFI
jgi:hypothetical protein